MLAAIARLSARVDQLQQDNARLREDNARIHERINEQNRQGDGLDELDLDVDEDEVMNGAVPSATARPGGNTHSQ